MVSPAPLAPAQFFKLSTSSRAERPGQRVGGADPSSGRDDQRRYVGLPRPLTIPNHQADYILIARAIVWAPSNGGQRAADSDADRLGNLDPIGSQVGQPAVANRNG